MTVHTIPVPEGWSVEQAHEAIRRGDPMPPAARWANVLVEDDPFPCECGCPADSFDGHVCEDYNAPPLPRWLWYWVVEPVLSLLSWIAYGRRK